MVFRKIGTSGPQEYTQAEANELIIDYPDFVKVGTLIRITDLGNPPGGLFMFDGINWAPISAGGSAGGGEPLAHMIYVAKNGNDQGDGSVAAPFETIGAAVLHAENFTSTATVIISVMPGIYDEDVVITRPRTIIAGQNGAATGTQIIGSVTITPSSLVGTNYTSVFALDDIMIVQEAQNINNAITVNGEHPVYIRLRNVKTFGTNQGGLHISNTNVTKSNVYLENVDIKSAGKAFALSNANGFSRGYFAAESTNEEAAFFSKARFTFNPGAVIVTQNAPAALTIYNNSVISVHSGSLTNNLADDSATNGADIALILPSGKLRLTNVDMFGATVGETPGFAVNGLLGSSLEYSGVSFFGNNRISSQITLTEITQVPTIV